MGASVSSRLKIVELRRDNDCLPTLQSKYITISYYDLVVTREPESWGVKLCLKPFEKPLEKSYTGKFFEAHGQEPRVFAVLLNGEQVGWIELGYDKWNNRMRVWEFLVEEKLGRKGIGAVLMKHAVEIAIQEEVRMLVLETQSCNAPAIKFYVKQGFDLIGFDLAAYSNEDVKRREVRLEFGLPL